MALDLYMVGLRVKDLDKTLAFYRLLGLDIPEREEGQVHIPVKMQMTGGFTQFFDPRAVKPEDPTKVPYSVLLEYFFSSPDEVKTRYDGLIAAGYESYHSPGMYGDTMYFAFVYDPDGNVVLLSAEVNKA